MFRTYDSVFRRESRLWLYPTSTKPTNNSERTADFVQQTLAKLNGEEAFHCAAVQFDLAPRSDEALK
jgi:hypothetical protein